MDITPLKERSSEMASKKTSRGGKVQRKDKNNPFGLSAEDIKQIRDDMYQYSMKIQNDPKIAQITAELAVKAITGRLK